MLAASTKQVNQFFLRFNGEEDKDGKRLYSGNSNYRSSNLRKNYLPNLFDQYGGVDETMAKEFARQVADKRAPLFLDRHHDDWLAEVNATFNYQGRSISGLLYMRFTQQGQGYAWVIEDVSFDILKKKMTKNFLKNFS